MEFLVLIFLIGQWLVGHWSVHLVDGRLLSGQWQVVGWSVGRQSVVGGSLVDGFKKTQIYCLSSALISLRLDIFVSHTNIARNLHLPGFEKNTAKLKTFLFLLQKLKDTNPFSWIRYICVCSKKYQESLPHHRGKEIICIDQ